MNRLEILGAHSYAYGSQNDESMPVLTNQIVETDDLFDSVVERHSACCLADFWSKVFSKGITKLIFSMKGLRTSYFFFTTKLSL